MRVLCVFVDMVRPNRLQTFNDQIKVATPLDEFFAELGGQYYKNCFTPAPDTPRSLSCFFTGVNSYRNGCNTRLKWPGKFLKPELKSVFDLFLEKNYKLDLFTSLNEQRLGFFPTNIATKDLHNRDIDLKNYLSGIKLVDDHFVFISIPDFHWAFDDYGYSTTGEAKAYKQVRKSLDLVFSELNRDYFDDVFIFSDHGFKFSSEMKTQPSEYLLSEDRTNILMHHRKRGDTVLKENKKLCSICDFFPTFKKLLGEDLSRGQYSLLDEAEHEYVISEDHINFTPELNQNIELWSLINKEDLYIRKVDQAFLINRQSRCISKGAIPKFDNLIASHSSYGVYADEYVKIFNYKKEISDHSSYMNGTKRNRENNFVSRFNKVKDLIKKP